MKAPTTVKLIVIENKATSFSASMRPGQIVNGACDSVATGLDAASLRAVLHAWVDHEVDEATGVES